MLYDFYGELLTDKQKNAFELYHLNDLSLNEIGIECDISRQAVLDNIKRTEKLLFNYEKKLYLVEKYLKQKNKINDIINKIEKVSLALGLKEDFHNIKSDIATLLD